MKKRLWAVPLGLGLAIGLCSCASTYDALGIASDEDLERTNAIIQDTASVAGPYGDIAALVATGVLTCGWRFARKKGWLPK